MRRKIALATGGLAILLYTGAVIFISACSIFEYKPVVMTPPSIPGASYIGWEACAGCHEKEYKYFELSDHASVAIDVTYEDAQQDQAEACETCHGPGSLHIEDSTNKDLIIRANAETACFNCHLDVKGKFMLQHHHPVPEGRMFCTDCHDMHGSKVMATGGKSLLGTGLLGRDEKCYNCHKEIRGPFVFEHEAMREGCSVCHTAHGSISDKLLVAGPTITCIRCHIEDKLGGIHHSNERYNCIDCHTKVHGSNNARSSLRY